jgi:drug/metabolite transporter (DMT)-like permease
MRARGSWLPYLILGGGVLVVASSSIMIRLLQEQRVPSIEIAAGRLLIAALILLPIALVHVRDEIRQLRRKDALLALLSGVLLAAHFASWIASLEYTSVASSVALVSTNPLWVGIASVVLLRERLRPAMWLAILLTLAGSILIGISDSSGPAAGNATFGNLLALCGAVSGSGYFLIGRILRPRMTILMYIWLVYSCAALFLLLAAFARTAGPPAAGAHVALLSYPPAVYLLLAALAVGPQLLGHTSFNWALRYLSATFITVSILGEPIGSALLALLLFGEQFAPLQLGGFVVLLGGIVLAARAEQREPHGPSQAARLAPDRDFI